VSSKSLASVHAIRQLLDIAAWIGLVATRAVQTAMLRFRVFVNFTGRHSCGVPDNELINPR